MQNEKGVEGIWERNERLKGMMGGKFDCVGRSKDEKRRGIDILQVGECMIECICEQEVCEKERRLNVVYVCREGRVREGEMEVVGMIMSKNEVK